MVIRTNPERVSAHTELMRRVTDLAEDGEHVPCLAAEGTWFTNDDLEIQNAAARLCRDCPALAACASYITEHPEPAGAWAGTTENQRAKRRTNNKEKSA